MPHFPDTIEYSDKYYDDTYEYRHVLLSKGAYTKMPKGRTLNETELRGLGITMSLGWIHYAIHAPEPFILLFRRPKGTNPSTGLLHAPAQLASTQAIPHHM